MAKRVPCIIIRIINSVNVVYNLKKRKEIREFYDYKFNILGRS